MRQLQTIIHTRGPILNVDFLVRPVTCRSTSSRTLIDDGAGNGVNRPEPVIPRITVKVSDAATLAVHARQSVLTLSANSCLSDTKENTRAEETIAGRCGEPAVSLHSFMLLVADAGF